MVLSIWHYRLFILSSVKNEIFSRFSRSALGGSWLLLHPLSQVLMYALVLSKLLSSKLPGIENKYSYVIYLMTGLVAWSLFNDIVLKSLNLFIKNGNLIKKVQFPKITLPVTVTLSALIENSLLFLITVAAFVLFGHQVSLSFLLSLPLMLLLAAFALGLGLFLGVLNVFIRDIQEIVPIVLQLLFWFTPIVYPENILPAHLKAFLKFNPLYHVVESYHRVFCYNLFPSVESLFVLLFCTLLFLFLSFFVFKKSLPEMVDKL